MYNTLCIYSSPGTAIGRLRRGMIMGMKIPASYIHKSRNVDWCIGSRECPNNSTLLILHRFSKVSQRLDFLIVYNFLIHHYNTLYLKYMCLNCLQAPPPNSALVEK